MSAMLVLTLSSFGQLTIKTTTVVGEAKTEVVSIIKDAYFEAQLDACSNEKIGLYYNVRNVIEEGKITNKVFTTKFSEVVDKSTKQSIKFKTSTEFLNFMASNGYDMVDQIKSKYHTNYTFKKK